MVGSGGGGHTRAREREQQNYFDYEMVKMRFSEQK